MNKQALGRFWSIGPQYTLFTPGPWLNQGRNVIILFDLLGTSMDVLKSVIKPIYGPATAKRD